MIRSSFTQKPAKRKCTICRTNPVANSMASVCSVPCAIKKAQIDREKKDADERREARAVDRKRKEEMKTRSDWMREAQAAFNAWIRARDVDKPCISCGAPPPDMSKFHAGRDAGHYRSVGSAPHVRFHEHNCHAQCVKCNQYGAGRAVDYRIGLIARVGVERVEALEADQTPRRYSIAELKELKATYKAKLKQLLAARAAGSGE